MESAWLVADTVTGPEVGATLGAVYSPVLLISPAARVPPVFPFTLQVTVVLLAPDTVAVNWAVWNTGTDAEVGEILMLNVTVKLTEFEAPPPGAGFVTTTAKVPAVAWSLALSEMVNWVELT